LYYNILGEIIPRNLKKMANKIIFKPVKNDLKGLIDLAFVIINGITNGVDLYNVYIDFLKEQIEVPLFNNVDYTPLLKEVMKKAYIYYKIDINKEDY